MLSVNWTLSDNQTIAQYVPLEDFTGLLQQRIGISPDHVALLMRDGRIVDTFTGGHFAVGGVWQRLKEAIGGTHAVRLLVADLKPFQIEGAVEGLSKDSVTVAGSVAIEFQVNPEKPANILGLMAERGTLTKPDVYARVLPHLRDRVYASVLARVDAADLRGNPQLQDKIQADLLLEVRRVFQDVGLLVRAVSMTWGLNDVERERIQRSAAEREQAMLDYRLTHTKRGIEREKDTTEFRLRTDLDVEKLKATGEDELKHLILDQELSFIDARDSGVRAQELKKLAHELEVLATQRRAGYQKALEDAQNDVDRAVIRQRLTTLDVEIDSMKEEHRLKIGRLQEEQNLALASAARRQQLDALREMNTIDLDKKERDRRIEREDRIGDHELALKAKEQAHQSEIERLTVQAKMTPDQILAVSAGLSPDIARVFAERAKTESIGADKREALLREMVQLSNQGRMASEEQARFFFDKAMQPAAPTRAIVRTDCAVLDPVECPGCHKTPPSTDKFCRYCGRALRV